MSSEDPQQPPPCRLPSVLWGEQKPGACLCAEAGEGEGLSSNPNILADKPLASWSPAAHPSLGGDEPQLHRMAPTCPISAISLLLDAISCPCLSLQIHWFFLEPSAASPMPGTWLASGKCLRGKEGRQARRRPRARCYRRLQEVRQLTHTETAAPLLWLRIQTVSLTPNCA